MDVVTPFFLGKQDPKLKKGRRKKKKKIKNKTDMRHNRTDTNKKLKIRSKNVFVKITKNKPFYFIKEKLVIICSKPNQIKKKLSKSYSVFGRPLGIYKVSISLILRIFPSWKKKFI